jgi:hypothetical protein
MTGRSRASFRKQANGWLETCIGPEMKPSTRYFAIAASLAVCLSAGASFVASGRTAEASVASPAIARPDFTPEPPRPRLDLTRVLDEHGRKELVKMAADPAICREALTAAGVEFEDLPAMQIPSSACGYENAVVVKAGYSSYSKPLEMSCPLAARLYAWEFEVVAPAAEKYFGTQLDEIEMFGSFSCRTRAGDGKLSHHGRALAADIAGFRLADGRTVMVEGGYWKEGAEGDFLKEVHKGACGIFDVTLGPAYNEAHSNHLHVDVGGERACR